MMKSFRELPDGYTKYFAIDLQKEKKTMILVNLLSLLIAVVMIVPACFSVPISISLGTEAELRNLLTKLTVLLVMDVGYLFLHELTHGAAMKICGTEKIKYGFTGLYAYAGSEEYYDKSAYLFIALAPVVLFFVLLAVVNALVPLSWFWVIYLIQVINVSGSVGDLYVTFKLLRKPKDLLVKDAGVSMTVYVQESLADRQ